MDITTHEAVEVRETDICRDPVCLNWPGNTLPLLLAFKFVLPTNLGMDFCRTLSAHFEKTETDTLAIVAPFESAISSTK